MTVQIYQRAIADMSPVVAEALRCLHENGVANDSFYGDDRINVRRLRLEGKTLRPVTLARIAGKLALFPADRIGNPAVLAKFEEYRTKLAQVAPNGRAFAPSEIGPFWTWFLEGRDLQVLTQSQVPAALHRLGLGAEPAPMPERPRDLIEGPPLLVCGALPEFTLAETYRNWVPVELTFWYPLAQKNRFPKLLRTEAAPIQAESLRGDHVGLLTIIAAPRRIVYACGCTDAGVEVALAALTTPSALARLWDFMESRAAEEPLGYQFAVQSTPSSSAPTFLDERTLF